MKLNKIVFHAYKSLVNVELEVNHSCIGFVGINESGKSNILNAIHVLGGESKLIRTDTPKMVKEDPFITYVFELNNDEFNSIKTMCNDLFKKYIFEFNDEIMKQKIIRYNIIFNRQKNIEYRYFDFPEITINENLMILKSDKYVNKYQIKTSSGFKNIENCKILLKDDFDLHLELEQKITKLAELAESLLQKENEFNEISDKKANDTKDDEPSTSNETEENERKKIEKIVDINAVKLKDEISNLRNSMQLVSDEIKDYKVPDIIKEIEKKNMTCDLNIKNELKNKQLLNEDLKPLKALSSLNSTQSEKIAEIEEQLRKADNSILLNKTKIDENNNTLSLLKETISEKYTNEKEMIIGLILDELKDFLNSLLPRVVFWEYDEKYLQQSKVNFEKIMQQKNLADLPRPLLNIFRISFGNCSLEDIKAIIREAQGDGNERNRISDQLSGNVNDFLKRIWADYDQNIRITIDENEVRVAIFDPVIKKNASYYSLIERSQGCRTFISFLLTIGAEANKKVLKNTILLLDEPETHLHPTGVKFMLKELIKIAETDNNIVFYATHSMFMIDRNDFSRHVIVKKNREATKLEYALSDRIGCFMQEEVLYNALNIEFGEFDSTGEVNFVFEGYGDTILFKNVYNSLTVNEIPFPIKDCVFHHGGGCDKILKYLKNNPMKIGTKWIFILDSDEPADVLIKFIESKFKKYLKKDVFIFQYTYDDIEHAEFEDLLPDNIKLEAYNNVLLSESKETIDKGKYSLLIKDHLSFYEQYNEITKNFDLVEDHIKGLFKEMLNKELENNVKNNKMNKEEYSNYFEWFKEAMKSCKKDIESEKKEKDQESS